MCHLNNLKVARSPLPLPRDFSRMWLDVKKIIDTLHIQKDKWCRKLYSPEPVKLENLNTNTMCCEQTFTWLSRHKRIFNSIPKTHHHFYLYRMVKWRNAYIEYCYAHGRRPVMLLLPLVHVNNKYKVCKQGRDDARSTYWQSPSLHLFHTTVSARKLLGSYLIATYKAHIPTQLHILLDHMLQGHVLLWHYHKSVLTVALYTCLLYNLDPVLEWTADWVIVISVQNFCTALIAAWMGAGSATIWPSWTSSEQSHANLANHRVLDLFPLGQNLDVEPSLTGETPPSNYHLQDREQGCPKIPP